MTTEQHEIELLKARLARELEERKIQAATELEDRKGQIAIRQAMLVAASTYANGAMRGLLVINGGAIIGLLTFVGNIRKTASPTDAGAATSLIGVVDGFAGGLACSLLALGLSYLAQIIIMEAKPRVSFWFGGFLRIAAILSAVASLLAFVISAHVATKAVKLLL